MNIFTKDDYRKIQAWLKANSIKDSDLTSVNDTIPEEDTLVLVQKINGILSNVKISIKNLLNSTLSKIIIDTIIANAVKVNNTLTVTASNVKIDNEKGTTLQDVLDYFEGNKLNRHTDDTFDGNLTVKKNITIEGNIKSHNDTITVEADLEATGEITDGQGNMLSDVNDASKGWKIEYQDPQQDEPTVRAKYVLKDYRGVPKGSVIKIYKDSAITNVYLGTVEDTCNPNTGEVTKHPIHDNNEALSIVYRLDTGKYSLVNVPIKMFVTEAEFDKYRGLGVTSNGQVFIKLASDVESSNYLHFNELGEITADGIEARILRDLGNIITSIAGDGTMWGVYKEHEGTQETSTPNDGSRWGEFKRVEEIREQIADSTHQVFSDNWDVQDDDPEDYDPLAVTEASFAYNWKSVTNPNKTGNIEDLVNKVAALAVGIFYGYYPNKNELPQDITEKGYAYVGTDNPYKIYNFDGSQWKDSGTTIQATSEVDEEDITYNENNKLTFKDRNNTDGMGYVILRKNKSFTEQVTKENTIYEIRYNFDLNGETINIPENCILKFEGGSLSNGFIDFKNNSIVSKTVSFSNIDFINLNYIEASWFGINESLDDISELFNDLIERIRLSAKNANVTIKFKETKYKTTKTLRIGETINGVSYNHSISIIGHPTFFMDNDDANCISISNAIRARYEFSVHRKSPAIWANDNSIGVVLINCLYCNFNIHNILYFTYGIIIKAVSHGFAWNEIYIDEIYSALQSFVVESIADGWPNANNVHGGIGFNLNTGTFVKDGAKESPRAIVFKSDGSYGANSWTFDGLWIENNKNFVPDYIGIDVCNYINQATYKGLVFDKVRVELTGIKLIQLDSRYVYHICLTPTISGKDDILALDYDGTFIADERIYNVTTQTLRKNLATVSLLSDNRNCLNCKKYSIFRGFSKFGISDNGNISTITDIKTQAIALKDVQNVNLYFKYYGRLRILFLDSNRKKISKDYFNNYVKFDNSYEYNDILSDNATNTYNYLRLQVKANDKIKFIVLRFSPIGDDCTIEYRKLTDNAPIPQLCSLFGKYPKDAYISEYDINSIRAKFETGDTYINYKTNEIYNITKGGSVGNISDIRVSGNINTSIFTTNDDVSNLLIGDLISINNINYNIVDIKISEGNNTITVDSIINDSVDNARLYLIKPIIAKYINPESTIITPNNISYIILCKDDSTSSCTLYFYSGTVSAHAHKSCFSGFVQISGFSDKQRLICDGYLVNIDISLVKGTYNNNNVYALKIDSQSNLSLIYTPINTTDTIVEAHSNSFTETSLVSKFSRGTTRPLNPDTGFQYFDNTSNKPIWWTGTKWVDATGADV